MISKCPTCGSRVEVVTGEEGTSYFVPIQNKGGNMNKEEQKQHIIDIMKADEEAGLYYDWSKLAEIAPPEKWMEMYENYKVLFDVQPVNISKLGEHEQNLIKRNRVLEKALTICFETLRQVFKDNPNTKI